MRTMYCLTQNTYYYVLNILLDYSRTNTVSSFFLYVVCSVIDCNVTWRRQIISYTRHSNYYSFARCSGSI